MQLPNIALSRIRLPRAKIHRATLVLRRTILCSTNKAVHSVHACVCVFTSVLFSPRWLHICDERASERSISVGFYEV